MAVWLTYLVWLQLIRMVTCCWPHIAFACACDISTALIPQFLLWNVQMKTKTKRQLNALFGLGLITAALSIARATTITKKTLVEDTTCKVAWTPIHSSMAKSWTGNMTANYYLSSFEVNLGMIFACGPAIRQFWAYRSRTHTSLPTKRRQYPNEDFEKMRYRINLRDIFWYRQAQMVGNRVFDAAPIFKSKSPPPNASSGNPQVSSQVSNSALDDWERRIKKMFTTGSNHKVIRFQLQALLPIPLNPLDWGQIRPLVIPRPRSPTLHPLKFQRSRNLLKHPDQITYLPRGLVPVANGACSHPDLRTALAALIGQLSCSPIVKLIQMLPRRHKMNHPGLCARASLPTSCPIRGRHLYTDRR